MQPGNSLEKNNSIEKAMESQTSAESSAKVEVVGVDLNFLNENADSLDTGEVVEDEKKGKEAAGDPGVKSGQSTTVTTIQTKPTVKQMTVQIEAAIMTELQKCYQEEREIKKRHDYSPADLNAVVIRIRNLNQILGSLKDYLRLAEEYIIGLWNTYVVKKK